MGVEVSGAECFLTTSLPPTLQPDAHSTPCIWALFFSKKVACGCTIKTLLICVMQICSCLLVQSASSEHQSAETSQILHEHLPLNFSDILHYVRIKDDITVGLWVNGIWTQGSMLLLGAFVLLMLNTLCSATVCLCIFTAAKFSFSKVNYFIRSQSESEFPVSLSFCWFPFLLKHNFLCWNNSIAALFSFRLVSEIAWYSHKDTDSGVWWLNCCDKTKIH